MTIPPSAEPRSIPGSRAMVALGAGNLNELGRIAKDLGARHVLLVSDPGVVKAGHTDRAQRSLRDAGLTVSIFDGVAENPTTEHVSAGVAFAKELQIDFIVGVGGGSAMDCAKGINFILTNGGRMQDYWGVDRAKQKLLPLIAVPTTAGTGSDAQSYALITDPQTHQKMACGDHSALPKVAILDPDLTATQPPRVAASTGIDAITHAIESSASTKRNEVSRAFSRSAWDALNGAFERAMNDPSDTDARQQMLVGAHLAGAAIENSMLGAAHSIANALTAECGIVHGMAVGVMLPYVIRFNASGGVNPYNDLESDAEKLAVRMEQLLTAAGMPLRLGGLGIDVGRVPAMVSIAARQWTARFNPRPVTEDDFNAILRAAL